MSKPALRIIGDFLEAGAFLYYLSFREASEQYRPVAAKLISVKVCAKAGLVFNPATSLDSSDRNGTRSDHWCC